MNDFSELNEHAAILSRQIGSIRSGLSIEKLIKKSEVIERKIGELRSDKNCLSFQLASTSKNSRLRLSNGTVELDSERGI